MHCDFPCSRSRVGGSAGPWVCVVLVMATGWGPSSRGSGQREEKGGAAASPRGRAGAQERERGRDTRQVRGEEAARPAGGGVDGGLRARGAGRAAGIVGWTVSTARAPLGASGRARPAGAPGSGPLPPCGGSVLLLGATRLVAPSHSGPSRVTQGLSGKQRRQSPRAGAPARAVKTGCTAGVFGDSAPSLGTRCALSTTQKKQTTPKKPQNLQKPFSAFWGRYYHDKISPGQQGPRFAVLPHTSGKGASPQGRRTRNGLIRGPRWSLV